MIVLKWLDVSDEVRSALAEAKPIVALESTLIAHGLPWPINVETALKAEQVVRHEGAIPATIAVWKGRPLIGLNHEQIAELAALPGVLKASRRDLATAIVQKKTAATTVAATMFLAHAAGIGVFATGGIGGAHRDTVQPFDISADLGELARTPVLVVCAGAKSILDLPRTLEILETLGVPVVGFRTSTLPAFYVRDSGLSLAVRVETAEEAGQLFATHRGIGGAGMVLAQPIVEEFVLSAVEFDAALARAEEEAVARSVSGPAVTPFLLAHLAELTEGKSLIANCALIVANARLAAKVARSMASQLIL